MNAICTLDLGSRKSWRFSNAPALSRTFSSIPTSPSAKTLRPDERQPFKERWLGRYIAYDIESFFVAITEVSTVAGYLAGCLDNPAHNPRFADNGYYASFGPLCDPYPCHLHINPGVVEKFTAAACRPIGRGQPETKLHCRGHGDAFQCGEALM